MILNGVMAVIVHSTECVRFESQRQTVDWQNTAATKMYW